MAEQELDPNPIEDLRRTPSELAAGAEDGNMGAESADIEIYYMHRTMS